VKADAKAELAQAAHLIRTHGYGRRYAELSDALECGSLLPLFPQQPAAEEGS